MKNIFLDREEFSQVFNCYLKIENYSIEIESLFSDRSLGKIDYKPHYQRNYVWDKNKASYFIESILLGTEIPPLIFYKKDSATEVIDGRQRFETIKRFKSGQLVLTRNGLSGLKQLNKSTYDSLLKDPEGKDIIEIFLSAKIRIIEFKINSNLQPDSRLEDKIKKEIFRRYNSGITPLKKFDIDNAIYVDDEISLYFKHLLKQDPEFATTMFELFFNDVKNNGEPNTGKILQFIRRHLVLGNIPIVYYARGTNRVELTKKLYDKLVNESADLKSVCSNFIQKVQIIRICRQTFTERDYKHNRLVYECLLWSLTILEQEGINFTEITEPTRLETIGREIYSNLDKFAEIESHYYSNIVDRFERTAEIVGDSFNLNLSIYISASSVACEKIKQLKSRQTTDTITKLSELENLRITKPDPSRTSVYDLAQAMNRCKFIIRPAYQREEEINLSKASAIIESILLDICLPPIFIFKRRDNISEVIDGQQRLLTILGYIGKEYISDSGERTTTKNCEFALKGLNILKKLNRKKFKQLSFADREKIWDSKLLVIEILESINPQFNPVDLFVRLNDKPYPIRENSFEMWNSWVDFDLIDKIKSNFQKHKDWFYIRANTNSDGSRMLNEELYTSLAYLEYQRQKNSDIWKYLYICRQQNRINVRIRHSREITKLLELVSQDETERKKFIRSIGKIESFISKLQLILLDKDIEDSKEKQQYFHSELSRIIQAKRDYKKHKRDKQDFYVLWCALSSIGKEMVAHHRLEIKQEIKEIFVVFKKSDLGNLEDSLSSQRLSDFKQLLYQFHAKYQCDSRKLKLSNSQKNQMIALQNNIDPISGAPLFIGDEVHADHVIPIAIGGEDSISNIQIAHPRSNLDKGAKYS